MKDAYEELKRMVEEQAKGASLIEKARESLEEQKKIQRMNSVAFTDYFWDWVDGMLEKNESIHNHTSFGSSCVTEEDYDNYYHLEDLYAYIEEYASRNYIYPVGEGFVEFYNLKRNDSYYEIGLIYGQGSSIYIKKTAPVPEYVDFECLKDDIDTPRRKAIAEGLAKVYEQIDVLTDNRVPPVIIKNEISDYLTKTAEEKAKIKKIGSKK
jgi:hypothetical protein